jgi:glyoxylase-like metal-dependent hydrolase (beta-lactamase superfamily II)
MGITHNRDFEPTYHQMEQLSPLVRRVIAKNPNPFTFKGTGTYLIGNGDVAVIDPGPALAEHLDEIVAGLGDGEEITKILITHTHTDHTAGVNGLVKRTGAQTYGFGPHGEVPDEDPLEKLSFDEYFTAEEKKAYKKAWDETPDELRREGPDTEFHPDVVVRDGDTIEGAGWTVDVVHTPGHTSNHVCFGLVDESLLFTGDHVMGWATSVISPPDGDLYDYMSSLEKLLDRNDVRYWPTHGPAIEDPQDYVRSFIEHRRARESQIVTALVEGPSDIKSIVPAMYAEVDKRLWRAAANSVFSHLLALHREGRVTVREGEPNLIATWELD